MTSINTKNKALAKLAELQAKLEKTKNKVSKPTAADFKSGDNLILRQFADIVKGKKNHRYANRAALSLVQRRIKGKELWIKKIKLEEHAAILENKILDEEIDLMEKMLQEHFLKGTIDIEPIFKDFKEIEKKFIEDREQVAQYNREIQIIEREIKRLNFLEEVSNGDHGDSIKESMKEELEETKGNIEEG